MFQRLIQPFVNRFEPDGQDYLYRSNPREAAIRVSAAERDAFVADFRRAMSLAFWLVVGLSVVVPIVTVAVIPTPAARYISFLSPIMAYLAIYRWAARAPSTALRSRGTEGVGKSREEARAIMLSRVTWRNLAILALVSAFALYSQSMKTDLTAGWNRLWLVGAAVFYAILAYRAYQKLRYGSGRASSEQ